MYHLRAKPGQPPLPRSLDSARGNVDRGRVPLQRQLAGRIRVSSGRIWLLNGGWLAKLVVAKMPAPLGVSGGWLGVNDGHNSRLARLMTTANYCP